jgi:hypothetical protein
MEPRSLVVPLQIRPVLPGTISLREASTGRQEFEWDATTKRVR